MKNIIILGNGLAGLSAAISCAEAVQAAQADIQVQLYSSNPPERSQSVMAEGGINAALDYHGEQDSPAQHAADTLGAGCDLADPLAVAGLCQAAPHLIHWLDGLGVVFNRDAQGRVEQRYFGGQKKMRTAYANAGVGKQLMAALSRRSRQLEAQGLLHSRTDLRFVSVIPDREGSCCGLILRETGSGQLLACPAQAVIMAQGGPGGLFGNNTGSLLSDGTATAGLFSQGVELANLEMLQFHPTTVAGPGKRLLISEAARGEGGRLFTYKQGRPWYFMEEWFPEGGNLMPRDVVSRSIFKVCRQLGLGVEGRDQVLLDLSFLPRETLEGRLGEICRTCRTFLGLDPALQPIPVWPGLHYFMGGIHVDIRHQTSMPRLLAAGEAACQYHGANRLGGNSTLGAIYGGRVAAATAVELTLASPSWGGGQDPAPGELARQQALLAGFGAKGPRAAGLLPRLQAVMNEHMALVRDEELLQSGLARLEELQERAADLRGGEEAAEALEFNRLLLLGRAMLLSAQERRESRGGHQRSDYPQRDDEHCRRTLIARCSGGKGKERRISLEWRQIGGGAWK